MNRFEGEVIDGVPVRSALGPGHEAHLGRITRAIVSATQSKYTAGQAEHGGECWLKPGMLAHAIDEATDLPVYLHTLSEQMLKLADRLREGFITKEEAADEIERWLHK